MQCRKQSSTSHLLSSVSILPLLLHLPLLLFLTSPHPCSGVDVGRLCSIRCRMGKGGNLCNCNAFHFAGKRSDNAVVLGGAGRAAGASEADEGDAAEEALQLGPRSLLELALRDVEDGHPSRALDVLGASGALAAASPLGGGRGAGGHGVGVLRGHLGTGVVAGRDGEDGRGPRVTSRGGERGTGGEGLFDVAVQEEKEEEEGERGKGGATAMERLVSLIKTALDER